MQILGCQTTDLKMFSIAKSACLRYIMRKNLKNSPGAAPPDPCRSYIGALVRTSLARSAALRADLAYHAKVLQNISQKYFLGADMCQGQGIWNSCWAGTR